MSIYEKSKKTKYILSLLGKKRSAQTTITSRDEEEVELEQDEDEDLISDLQYELLSEMTTKELNLEQELFSQTIEAQRSTEQEIKTYFDKCLKDGAVPHLDRSKHANFLRFSLGQLPPAFKMLDHSQPWLYYWSTNCLALLGEEVSEDIKRKLISKLFTMMSSDGGIGGGPGQIGHVAAAYSGVLAFANIGTEEDWAKIDRKAMYQWLMALKNEDGSFCMHIGGESDTRAVYCVLTIASTLNILTEELIEGTAEWIGRCQTYEGGIGASPFDEAHGGYTYCAMAGLLILGRDTFLKHINLEKLIHWIAERQLPLEGGFSGRTNKLVDGCYSFWIGGLIPMFDVLLPEGQTTEVTSRAALMNYLLCACQDERMGGLRDKPGKMPDYYHTQYGLLGVIISQSKFSINEETLKKYSEVTPLDAFPYAFESTDIDSSISQFDEVDRVGKVNPIFPVAEGVINKFKDYWLKKDGQL
ncbi:hypothetical protein WICPIJ_009068 [Wickerhamomyces pijperi]|uniref:Protein farnesyltransferase subunit beta n=1 Tax=Wickerhamomyces pijperi TaxID=599730 RepID=A0A9P8TEE0_WICPI|nr:hypothetical protein WICPIJ_009068 [Wickerhamomyces pijperi]